MTSSTKTFLTLKEKYDRVVVLVDMDAFYCQVEEKCDPRLKGKPIAVCQYQENSGIIAVNYPAKALGITRHMREREALAACKELVVIKVASKNGKADISKYRDAGAQVAKVFQKYTSLIERASIDEAYLDITEKVAKRMEEMSQKKFQLLPHNFVNTHAVGYDQFGAFIQDVSAAVDQSHEDIEADVRASYSSSKLRLLIASSIVSEIRKGVFDETGYTCSAGIAHNKILAKLIAGMNKPNKQTILPLNSITGLYSKLEISKIKSMGGKTGDQVCKTLNARVMNDLLKYTEDELTEHFGPRIGKFLYLIARGIDLERVTFKINSKSIAVSKNFRGASEIINSYALKYWLTQLSKEVKERLENDALDTNRVCRQLIVQFSQFIEGKVQQCSRTVQLNGNILNSYSFEEIASEAYSIIQKTCTKFLKFDDRNILNYPISHLGISAGKFETNNGHSSDKSSIQNFLSNFQKKCKEEECDNNDDVELSGDEEVVEEAPKIRVKSDVELLRVKEDERTFHEEEGETKSGGTESENDMKAVVKFNADNAIKGLRTLKHWISELFRQLDVKLVTESLLKGHAPQELELHWNQIINSAKMNFSVSLPIFIFSNDVITLELIIDAMKESSSDFMIDKKLNPITFIEFVPTNFKENEKWKLKLIEDKEDMTEHSMKETDESTDDAFSEQINKSVELDDAEELASLEQDFINFETDDNTDNNDQTPSTSTCDKIYTQTYAEYSGGDAIVNEFNPLEKCLECGKLIRKWDMLTHVDSHMAMRIAQMQRDEFRAEQMLKKFAGKTKETIPKSKKVFPVNNSIDKFTKKRDDNSEVMDSQIICDECSEVVEETDFQMHNDHHFAQKLRKEQMKNVPWKSNDNNKRKRPSTATSTSSSSNNAKKTKSLKDFFSN